MDYKGSKKTSTAEAKRLYMLLLAGFPSPMIDDFEAYSSCIIALLTQYPKEIADRAVMESMKTLTKPPTHAEMYAALQLASAEEQKRITSPYPKGTFIDGDTRLNDDYRIALCHAWMRARDFGDPKAEEQLLKFTRHEIAKAQTMKIEDAIRIIPKIADRLSKPVAQYGKVGHYEYKIPAAEFEHIWNKKVRMEDSKSLFEQVREIMNKTEPHFETRGWELSEPTDKQHGGDDEQASGD